jgi:thiol-disulfide isomerase/thioredoxin
MLVASLFVGPSAEATVRQLAWRAMLVLVGAVAGSAVWFVIVQKWIIGSFCPYCMATHINGLLLTTLVIWRAPKPFDDGSNTARPNANAGTARRRVIGALSAVGLAMVGLLMAGIMAICQFHFVPPAIYQGGEAQNKMSAVDSRTAPLIGSPNAPYVVTLLFDYKCPHCQQIHFMLDEVVRRYAGKLAIVLCPAPLNTKCNPFIPRDVNEFKDSCELAKIGLAVWVAKREAFSDFERWMFSFESGDRWHPRSLDAVRAKALEIVGQAKFDAALADPWVEHYLQNSVRIYGETVQDGRTAIPKLVFGSHWVTPQPNDTDDLVSILQNSLAIPAP